MVFTEAATEALVKEAGEIPAWKSPLLILGGQKYDLKYSTSYTELDRFTIDGRLVSPSELGNYIAGYVGHKKFSGPGYGAVVIGGIFYDFIGALLVGDLEDWDWDADSQYEIHQGALRAAMEALNRSNGCTELNNKE